MAVPAAHGQHVVHGGERDMLEQMDLMDISDQEALDGLLEFWWRGGEHPAVPYLR